MALSDLKSLRDRLRAMNIRQSVFSAYAKVHDGDVSRVIRGLHVATGPVERMTVAIAALEDLVGAVKVKPDLSSVHNIEMALARLTEIRNTATAPWQYRGAVAEADDAAVSNATGILAGASE